MKICSLLPSGTEILFALGLGDQVAGVSDLCDFPVGVQGKPVVSRSKVDPSVLSSEEVEVAMTALLSNGENPYNLDQEWLVKESPDVILTQDLCHVCEVDAGQVTGVVAGMDIQPHIVVLQPRTFEGILESILEVGRACEVEDQANLVVAGMRQRVQAIQDKLASVMRRPRVFSLEGINPLVVGGHWIPDMLRLAGGNQDMFASGCGAERLDWDVVRKYDPDKLFIDLCSSDLARNLREAPWLEMQSGWRDLSSVRNGEVYLIDHSYFSRPGPRTIDGLELLAGLTHPEFFFDLVPRGSVVKLDGKLYTDHSDGDIGTCFRPYP
jgi:iron complex transport system substrate-binding protein